MLFASFQVLISDNICIFNSISGFDIDKKWLLKIVERTLRLKPPDVIALIEIANSQMEMCDSAVTI